jgi:hypothetical protein
VTGVLAAIGGISGGVGLIAVIVLAFKLVAAAREQIAARDLLDQEREQHAKTRGELVMETAAHAVTRDELRKEKDLRASAESQRNGAYLEEREHVVTIVKTSNIADAAGLVSHLLSAPLANGLPPLPAAGAARSSSDPDALIDPGL